MLIDIHAHLTDKRYGGDTQKLVNNFSQKRVGLVVDAGYDLRSSSLAYDNAEKYTQIYATLGVHPEKPYEYDGNFEKFLIEKSESEKVIAIGEIGLDYHYDGYDKNLQREVFEKQITLADKLKLPIVVHSRDCSSDMLSVLTDNKKYLNNGFLMHCYSESKETAKKYLDLGAYFSFGGVITFKNSKKDEIVKSIPLDRILTETDCPYLTPHPHRGETNYPEMVELVYTKLCDIFNIDFEGLEKVVESNAKTLFKKLK